MKRMLRSWVWAVGVAVALSVCPAAFGGEGKAGADPRPGKVVWAGSRDLVSSDAHMWDVLGDLQIHNLYMESLVRNLGWDNFVPMLATSWDISPDGLTYTFHLRKGVKFHSGDDLTAEDVVFSAERLKTMPAGSMRSHFSAFKGARAVDADTVELVFTQPNPLMLYDVSYIRVYSKKQAERDGEKFHEKFNGTGPWKLTSWKPGEHIRFAKNAEWWDTYPEGSPSDLEYRAIPEEATRMAALMSGEVDAISYLSKESMEQVQGSDILQVVRLPDVNCIDVVMKNDKPPFDDPKFRQAMDYLVPREIVVKELLGQGTPASIWSQQFYPWFPQELKGVVKPFDEAKAKELIAQSKYRGEEFRLMTRRGRSPKDLEICEFLASVWNNLGVKAKVEVVADAAYSQRRAAGDYEMFMSSWDVNSPAFYYEDKYKAHQINRHLSDPKFNELVQAVYHEADWDKFLEKTKDLERYLFEDPAALHIYYTENIWGLSKRLESFKTLGGDPFPLFEKSVLMPAARATK